MQSRDLKAKIALLREERRKSIETGMFATIGSNRVPDDDPSYVEDRNAIETSIAYVVSQSMM